MMDEDSCHYSAKGRCQAGPNVEQCPSQHVMQGKRPERVSRILAKCPFGIPRRADRVAHLPHNWQHGSLVAVLGLLDRRLQLVLGG